MAELVVEQHESGFLVEDAIVSKIGDKEYLSAVSDKGQSHAGFIALANLTYNTNASESDIVSVEIKTSDSYTGDYNMIDRVSAKKTVTLGRPNGNVSLAHDDDVPVELEITLKDGTVLRDNAMIRVRLDELFFSNYGLSLNLGVREGDRYEDGEYYVKTGTCYGLLHLGVNSMVPRILNSIQIVSSDDSIANIDSWNYLNYNYGTGNAEFYIKPKQVGTVTITATAVDDSGNTFTDTITINVEAS